MMAQVLANIITKLIKIRGVNHKGGREYHNLIVVGKKVYKSLFEFLHNWVKYPFLELGLGNWKGCVNYLVYMVMSLVDFLLV